MSTGALQLIEPGSPSGSAGAVPDPNFSPDYANLDDYRDEDTAREVRKTQLASHVRTEWQAFRSHASTMGLKQALFANLQAYNGRYDTQKLQQIRQFGGSEVYARLSTVKCRGASSMLRDVFLGPKRPWDIEPTPVPTVPDQIKQNIDQLVQAEAAALQQAGQPVDPGLIDQRRRQLNEAANRAAIKTAKDQAKLASRKLDDILVEGGFYEALGEFLVDLPIFKFAVIKGPVVRQTTGLKWVNGAMQSVTEPRMFWSRVSPFNMYFTPGASSIAESDIIEKSKVSRSDLNALIGVPGYDEEAIRAALSDYDAGLVDFIDDYDSMVADAENRENPHLNRSGLIDMVEYHGRVRGQMLLDYGFTEEEVNDPLRDYGVDVWLVGQHVIKVQINPNPKRRHNYYSTSYEKVPGSIVGHSLMELIQDIQDVANATLRSLVNNMSIASGPQVTVNEDRLSPTTDADTLYPWKRWRIVADPMPTTSSEKPIDFFQPQSNAQELLQIYRAMMDLADEVSAIPRYITGSNNVGGAASTASGLSMLMGNSSKVLQNVAGQIDHDVMAPLLDDLYTMVMLTDTTGTLRGDERIAVKGVAVAIQKETDRMRKLEFLQITGNPLDMQIVGLEGRAALLRTLADDLGMPEAGVVPSEDELRARLEQQSALAQAQERDTLGASQGADEQAQAQGEASSLGNPAPKPGSSGKGRMGAQFDNMHRTNPPR